MKKLILVVLLSVPTLLFGQTVLWTEDFSGEANNATNGTAAGTPGGTWSVTTPPSSGTFSRQTILGQPLFSVNLTGVNEGVWKSNSINISGTGMATISVDLNTSATAATDYLRAYYKVDGGAEILFAELLGQVLNLTVNGSAIVSGSTLEVVIRGKENTNFFGLSTLSFDNVSITTVPAVYSRKNGSWTDNTAGNATWSAVALGGTSCDCVPTVGQVAVIGNSNTVTLPITSNQSVGGVDIKNTGVLQYNNNASTVTILMGLFKVESGGTVNSSGGGITGEQIIFDGDVGGANFQVDGTASIQDLVLSSNASNIHFITGGGSLTITGDILINASNATLTNDLTTTLNTTRLMFGATGTITGSTFTNNAALTLSGDLIVNNNNDDNNIFTNASTGVLNVAGVNTNSADFTVNNSGTINQTSNFTNIVAGGSFNNFNGSTWNFGGTHLGTPMRLFCNNGVNTFNYNRAAGANLITPQDAYSNLTISGSGAKAMGASFSVNQNLSISGTSSLNPATFNLTVNGTSTITGAAGASFNDTDATNTGISTFVGNVSVGTGTSFISTNTTTFGNLVFRGGIANAGTFTAGGATFDTNNQSLTGTAAMSFANNVAINGFTVTNTNTGAFTITGTTTLTSGGFTDNDDTSVTTLVGAVSQTGTSAFNFTNVFTSGNLIFRGGITNNGGTFTAGGATFNTNSQVIAGNTAISFANFVNVTGVTVTNSNTASVSLTRIPGGVTLTGTGTWTQGANSTLNYTGTSISITTFNASNAANTVNYNSTAAAQTIRIPSSTYANLRFNNTFGTSPQLTAAGALSISGILTMTSGNVDLNSNNITLTSNASGSLVHGLTSASGWIYGGGIVRAIPASAITIATVDGFFPLGSAADFRPFSIGKTAAGSGNITVSHTNANTTSVAAIADTGPVATIILRDDAFWTVSSTLAAGTLGVQYGGTGLGTVTNLAHLRSCLAASVIVGSTHVAASTVSLTDPRVERSGVAFGSLANAFYVGSTNVASPLPIELLYFHANLDHNYVNLNWATAQEINNDFFTIEKSANPEVGFEKVGKLPGQGNSTVKQEYFLVDRQPYAGLSYYRLKQTDFDGKFTYSKLVAVNYEGPQFATLKVYPNPYNASKDQLTIEISGLKDVQEIPVVIFNSLGQKMANQMMKVSQAGSVNENITFESPLTPGVFVIKAGSTVQLTHRLVVE